MWLKDAVSATSDTGTWVTETSLPVPVVADFDRRFESGSLGKANVFWMNILLFECAPDSVEQLDNSKDFSNDDRPVDGVHYKLIEDLDVDYTEFSSLESLSLTWFSSVVKFHV